MGESVGSLLKTFEGHQNWLNSAAFSPGNMIVRGSNVKTIKLWEKATGTPLKMFEGHHNSVISEAFSPDGKMIVSCSDHKMR